MRVRITPYLSEIIAYTSIAMQMIMTKFHHPRRYVIATAQAQLTIVMPMIIDQLLVLFIIVIYIFFYCYFLKSGHAAARHAPESSINLNKSYVCGLLSL